MGAQHVSLLLDGPSRIHRALPEVKLAAALVFVIGASLTPRRAVGPLLADLCVVAVMLHVATYRPRQVIARLTVVLPFIGLGLLMPFIGGGEQVEVGPISVSSHGLWAGWNTIAKTLIGFGASLVVAGTTPIPDLVRGLGQLKVPPVIVAIISLMFRYLGILIEEMGRMTLAMTARGYRPRWLWQAKPVASATGALFVRSYERGERVHAAMVARGFDGTMPTVATGAPDMPASQSMRSERVVGAVIASISILGAVIGAFGVASFRHTGG